jgi:hypothetical protein
VPDLGLAPLGEGGQCGADAEREHLEGHGALLTESPDELAVVDDDDVLFRSVVDDLFARVRAAWRFISSEDIERLYILK